MLFKQTTVNDAYLVEIQKHEDERGFFARTWCAKEFEEQGLIPTIVQCSVSFNKKKGTLRGLHYQIPPSKEAKLVRATKGSVFDVIVDIRPNSTTYLHHYSVILSYTNHLGLYIPPGFAHGFQTLENETEVYYQMTDFYKPEYSRGVRWNDKTFGINWPQDTRTIFERDENYPDFGPEIVSEVEGYW